MKMSDRTLSGEQLRIIYLAGPGDAPSVLRSLAAGVPYTDIPHVAYSGQVFDVCRELGAHVLSVSTHSRADDFAFGDIRAVNRVDPLRGKSGLGFHLANIELAREVRRDVAEFRANVVVTAPSPYPGTLIVGLTAMRMWRCMVHEP